MDSIPSVLYHYTNVADLVSILKNKEIRFKPLSKLNDIHKEEEKISGQYRKYVFVSCWTAESKESVKMWDMYSRLTEGVRIQLPIYPFEEYNFSDKLQKKYPNSIASYFEDDNDYVFIPFEDMHNKDYLITPIRQNQSLFRVKYTDNAILLCLPKTKYDYLKILGKHKNAYLSHEKELRYRLIFLPVEFIENYSDYAIDYPNIYNNDFKFVLPDDCYSLKISDKAFDDMKILTSPYISDENAAILELLKKEYNPNMPIEDSGLKKI